MAYNNCCHFIGRITADLELKAVSSRKNVLKFSIAINRPYNKDKTDFIDCVAWDKTADFISKFFHKGSMIALNGELHIESWVDLVGRNRKHVQLDVKDVGFCESKKEELKATSLNEEPEITEIDEDDLPF